MKRRLLAAILCLFAIELSAKDPDKIYRAIYDFAYTKDSIHAIKGEDMLYVKLSEDSSFCFSYYSYQTDSLMNEPDGHAI